MILKHKTEFFMLKTMNDHADVRELLIKTIESGSLSGFKKLERIEIISKYSVYYYNVAHDLAAKFGKLDLLKYIRKHESMPGMGFYSSLYVAAQAGHLHIVRYLYPHESDRDRGAALYAALEAGRLRVFKYLLLAGAPASTIDFNTVCLAAKKDLKLLIFMRMNMRDPEIHLQNALLRAELEDGDFADAINRVISIS